ncbi:RNA-binding S4 domain-containing protein [Phormidium sp. FACHB-592]|uniref:RNA-binding S4 domain-containing protein n=2 Tax=Stenomitos TaxID=1844270 RepID=A0ABV0KDS6_9CYAN|nr:MULTISPECIES: RNA-binding S4 domain-containing protein [Cyanophyceae]MBD2034829.1 RNA-binding S4 domain-containing protein [Leptolyngbya sp. FACHB-321]MBD2075966.1 RNA-binding S4 domain-containing protein [Phormidium sp. FACHB-592]
MIATGTIKLDQFLKVVGMVQSGGQAKLLIQAGEVKVNGAVETRRGRKLVLGDRVATMGNTFNVETATLQPRNANEPTGWE